MSEGRDRPFIHPFNYYIVNFGVETFHRFMAERDYYAAAYNLWIFLGWLEPEIRSELKDEIEELELMLRNVNQLTAESLRRVQLKVSSELHRKGYFLMAKAAPPTRTVDLEDMAKKLERVKA